MDIKSIAVAGTLESSDIYVEVEPSEELVQLMRMYFEKAFRE